MKKTHFLIIVSIFFTFAANAQGRREYAYVKDFAWNSFSNYEYTLQGEFKIYSDYKKQKISVAGISELSETIEHKKKSYLWVKIGYDKKGNCTSAIFYKRNGKLKKQFAFTYTSENLVQSKTMLNGKEKELKRQTTKYNKDSLITESVFYRKGKEIKKNIFAFNDYGQYTNEEYYKKGKIRSKAITVYDSTRSMESYFYKKGSPDYQWKWVYAYYEDKSRKSSKIYNSKGEVKYTWNYECKPEGELQIKHKDTSLICQKIEYDADSNETYTYRKFNEKGKPFKFVVVYTKNKKLLQQSAFHDEEIPIYFFKYNKVTDEIEQQIFYTHKGKERYKYICIFDSNNNIIETDSYYKGQKGKTVREFNTFNFVTTAINFGKKGKRVSTEKYAYSFF
jgi:hypothetical protein